MRRKYSGQYLLRSVRNNRELMAKRVAVQRKRGICQCGCEQKTTQVNRNRVSLGLKKGDFNKYVSCHTSRNIWKRYKEDKSTGCWNYTGKIQPNGYGKTLLKNGRAASVHRAFYLRYVGDINPGLHVDHLCHNRNCVNPKHLEAVTPRENTLRGIAWRKAHGQGIKWQS